MRRAALALLFLGLAGQSLAAKNFQNSYVSFDVPDDWSCLQEGVAWTCTPQSEQASKEAIIVLVAKVAGPEDSMKSFLDYLKRPKNITMKTGAVIPSKVMYAQDRLLSSNHWVQAQHLGSEIEDFYTLYLATVKNQLAILVSFSSEKDRISRYNPIFDSAIKSLKITASQELLFPKTKVNNSSDVIGIQVNSGPLRPVDLSPVPPMKKTKISTLVWLGAFIALLLAGAYIFKTRRKKVSHMKTGRNRPK
jgi:hypothetical protein